MTKLNSRCAGCGTELQEHYHVTCKECWDRLRGKSIRGLVPGIVHDYKVAYEALEILKSAISEELA